MKKLILTIAILLFGSQLYAQEYFGPTLEPTGIECTTQWQRIPYQKTFIGQRWSNGILYNLFRVEYRYVPTTVCRPRYCYPTQYGIYCLD